MMPLRGELAIGTNLQISFFSRFISASTSAFDAYRSSKLVASEHTAT
jgi:hypothetical protein